MEGRGKRRSGDREEKMEEKEGKKKEEVRRMKRE